MIEVDGNLTKEIYLENELNTLVRLNSLGFLPFQQKRASIAVSCKDFWVVNARNNQEVFRGETSGPLYNEDTGEQLFTADFSEITVPGVYYLRVDQIGNSIQFEIGNNIYVEPFRTVMLGMYLWRCGTNVNATYKGVTFSHAPCHLEDAGTDFLDGYEKNKPAAGGWHDAGDYNKYVVNAGISLYLMFMAWEQFKERIKKIDYLPDQTSESNLPHYLQEIKWEIDWLFSMQLENGAVSHKISTKEFCGFIMPEEEKDKRYFCSWGTTATADFCSIMAAAYRAFKEYDNRYADKCLNAAIKSYHFLIEHPFDIAPDQSQFHTGMYAAEDEVHRLWAAAEMWESTGEIQYLNDFESNALKQSQRIDLIFNWKDTKNLGMIRYLFSSRTGKNRDLVEAISTELLSVADSMVRIADKHGYNRSLGNFYCWGANGNLLNQVLVLQAAFTIKANSEYLNTALNGLGFIFGRNRYCRSFVTGIGFNPPLFPHDRRSAADKIEMPWPGYLVGGPAESANDYQDSAEDCRTNEIAINWNAALIYALAGFLFWE